MLRPEQFAQPRSTSRHAFLHGGYGQVAPQDFRSSAASVDKADDVHDAVLNDDVGTIDPILCDGNSFVYRQPHNDALSVEMKAERFLFSLLCREIVSRAQSRLYGSTVVTTPADAGVDTAPVKEGEVA